MEMFGMAKTNRTEIVVVEVLVSETSTASSLARLDQASGLSTHEEKKSPGAGLSSAKRPQPLGVRRSTRHRKP